MPPVLWDEVLDLADSLGRNNHVLVVPEGCPEEDEGDRYEELERDQPRRHEEVHGIGGLLGPKHKVEAEEHHEERTKQPDTNHQICAPGLFVQHSGHDNGDEPINTTRPGVQHHHHHHW